MAPVTDQLWIKTRKCAYSGAECFRGRTPVNRNRAWKARVCLPACLAADLSQAIEKGGLIRRVGTRSDANR